ncbi:MAG: SPOR domain-containing protein, partial [Marivita sp.]|uniref:SPOR domain-containing protein n=1 Tax=Marivita sp. TaxID=2003365 RepID=UPI003EF37664
VVQDVPAAAPRSAAPTRVASSAPAPQRRMAVATGSAATHLVQLGSFESRAVAQAKWAEMKSRFTQLADRDVVITEAVVNGRTYFRVAAAGFGSRSARSMCNTVKSAGVNCFAYAASSPPAGAVDRGVRIAARTR